MTVPSRAQEYTITTASNWSRRYFETYFDYHTHPRLAPGGRPWTGQLEQAAQNRLPKTNRRPSDGFVGNALETIHHVCDNMGNVDREATHASHWDAPYLPETKYFVFDDQKKRCRINYQLMKADLAREEEKYYIAVGKIAARKPDLKVYLGETPPYEIIAEIGITPPIKPQLADLFIGGNPWLLGFDKEVDDVARKLLRLDANGRNALGTSIYLPPVRPLVEVDEIIEAKPKHLDAIVADAVRAALASRDAEEARRKDADKARMAKVRASRTSSTSASPE